MSAGFRLFGRKGFNDRIMLRKGIFAISAIAALHTAAAQSHSADSVVITETQANDKYRVVTNMFSSNWFAGFGVGAQIYEGDHDSMMNFGDRIAPMGGIYIGKWFTPGIGVRFNVSGGAVKGLSGWTGHTLRHPTDNIGNYQGFIKDAVVRGGMLWSADSYDAIKHGYKLYETKMHFVQASMDMMLNLTQMIYGYKADRAYSFIPYLSVGFAHSLERAPLSNKFSHEFVGGAGFMNRFRLSKAWDINLDIRATLMGDHFDQEDISWRNGFMRNTAGSYAEGAISASVGLAYNFPRRDWERPTTTTIRINENVLAELRSRVGRLQADNDDLRRQLERALNREVTKENVAAQPLLVTFPIDRWTLSNKDRVNLGFLAEAIKANPKMVYSVVGYADKGTGSAKRNVFLARKRSEVIYDCLVNEFGVSESQLRRDDKGGVANMYYDDPRCSRAVLVKIAE